VEEGVRKALAMKPLKFESLDDALKAASQRLRTDSSLWINKLKKSVQLTLGSFFS
jgi:hypothetical protein